MLLETNGIAKKVNKNTICLEFNFTSKLVKHLFLKLPLWNANAKNQMQ